MWNWWTTFHDYIHPPLLNSMVYFYHLPKKLWEDNIFSRVCLFTGAPCDHYPWCIGLRHTGTPQTPVLTCPPRTWDLLSLYEHETLWTWDLTVQGPHPHPNLNARPHLDMGLFLQGPPPPFPAPLVITSCGQDLRPAWEFFHLRTTVHTDIWWLLKLVWLASGWCTSYWNAFLLSYFVRKWRGKL